jgi:hypothetical protein
MQAGMMIVCYHAFIERFRSSSAGTTAHTMAELILRTFRATLTNLFFDSIAELLDQGD